MDPLAALHPERWDVNRPPWHPPPVAVYTPLPHEEADRIARAHGLGAARRVRGVIAGSVNSNYFVETDRRRVFVRIYEDQEVEGVAYEWALLTHLLERGLPVPQRVEGPAPGELRVAGKPVAAFEVLEGDEVCQAMVDVGRARAVGGILASAHRAGSSFGRPRAGRFGTEDVRESLREIVALDRTELREATRDLAAALDRVDAEWDDTLPSGVIHGDLFRDNLRWNGDAIAGILDWESASDGAFVYDLAVTILAWCFGAAMDWELARAMVAGYEAERSLEASERAALPLALESAAARFTITRITDFHLRDAGGKQITKDWRRFHARLLAARGAPPL